MKLPHLRSEQIKTQPDQTSALINKIIDRVNDPNLGGGGGGGTSDFNELTNRPSYAGTTMTGSTNIPAVPTKTSQLNNDSGFVNTTDLTNAISTHNTSSTAHSDIRNSITSLSNSVTTIQNVIPSAATANNKLTDKNYVDDSINSVTAYYITKNAQGDPFATKAELTSATTFYSGGQVRIPTRNDYCIVMADESQRDPITGEDPTTRYIYNNGWEFQYVVNKTALTADQLAALNSGITANDVTKLSGIEAGAEVNVQSDWTEADNTSDAYIKNKPTIGNATLTIQRNGSTAQTFTANSTTNKSVDIQAPVRVDLRGQCQKDSYARSVIALCTITTTNNTSMNSFSSGRLSFHRGNGAAVDKFIDFIIGNQYSSAYKYYFSYSANIKKLNETADLDTSTGFRPCVFKYNNVWYAGIEYHSGNAVQQYVSYYGEKVNIDIFGLDYYNCSYTSGGTTYPSEILNQEVYDSLDYTKTVWAGALQANSLATDDGIISSAQGTNGAYTAILPTKNGTLAMTDDNVASATKLETARTIGINTGAWGTPTAFDGSSNITIPITDVKESYIVWGGKNTIDNNVPPATMGCLDEFGHNKFAYLPGECMTVAFTRDGGTTWLDYTTANGADFTVGNEHKIRFMTYGGTYFNLGGRSTNDVNPENDQLRIRVSSWSDSSTPKLYAQFKQLAINMSTQGASGTKVRIRVRTIQNWIDGVETWVDKGTYDLAGWSGWNTMPFDQRIGGSTTQKNQMGEIEFLFTQTDVGNNRRNSQIIALRGIASNTWNSPSELASSGRLYTIDADQTATFPGEIVSNRIYPNATNTYNLGASGRKWKHLYLAGNIINGNGDTIDLPSSAGTLALTSDMPTKTSDLTNDGENGTSTYIETDDAQILSAGQGNVIPDFTDMTPVETFTWSVSDTTYRPIYQMENTGWTYDNMDIDIAYRITVTGTGISQICDVHERWHNITNYPVTSVLNRTLSTTAATTGFRYLRAVYPTSGYVNNNTYKLGTEISCYNSTARTVKVEVFKTNSKVIWNTTKPAGSIYSSSTYHNSSTITTYATRGWIFRKPADFTATNADSASRVSAYEGYTIGSSALLSGEALTNHYMAFLADDGKIYSLSNTVQNMVCDGSGKIGIINGSAYTSGAAVSYSYFRPVQLLSATETTNTPHDAVTTGDRLYLRCTMDANGKIHSDNYLAKTMSAGYTWMPIGNATSSTQIYIDARRPTFYTLDANGNLSHINGQEIAASGIADGSISGSKFQLLTDVAVATDTPAGWVSELGGDGVYHIEYSTAGKFTNQPTTYGMLEVTIWGSEVDQIWHEHADGDMYKRSGNAYGWSGDPNNAGVFEKLVSREIKSLNAVSDAGWSADQYKIPDISMISYWNGAYSGTNSNLTYFASNSVTTANIQDGAITSVKLNDFNTANTNDTWVPVASNSKLQHRVIKPFNADGSVPASAVASDVAKTADTCYQAGAIDLGHRVLVGQTGGSNDHAYWTLPVNKSMDLVNISSITIDNDQNMHFGYSVPGGVSIRPVPGTIANISKQNGFITFETQLTASPGQYQMVMAQFGAINVTFTSI